MILASSLLAVVYVWKLVETMYFTDGIGDSNVTSTTSPTSMSLVAWLFVTSCIFFGFHTSFSVEGASVAARVLLEYTKQ